ncbi:hypothetical protein H4R24_002730 [Coemansia sp. RSA 988]|nr:hypothetical protein H4R24_002730 [Coemansia sp. RSA 988]
MALSCAVLDSSGMGALRYIHINGCVNQQPITELVHRNRECLERLHFSDICYDTLEWLVFGGNKDNNVCVFPQLKHLYADWKNNTVAKHLYKLPLNPFPRLGSLNCHELPAPSIAGVLLACRSQLLHLKVEISDDLWKACERLNVFKPGAFKRLHYMNVCMRTERVQSSVALNRFLVITRATVESSLGLQNLVLSDMHNDSVGRAFHGLRFPPALRRLTLDNPALSVDEALMMFRSCSWLERAIINLDYGIDGIPYEFAWDDCISALRERHQNAVSKLYFLGVKFTTDSQAYNSARILMLFAELLPDISRLYITVPDSDRVYDEVTHVLERPEYMDNARLHNVTIGWR